MLERFKAIKLWWLFPLGIFALTQLSIFLMLWEGRPTQEAIPQYDGYQYWADAHGANPPWEQFVSQWNGYGFREIAQNGYPKDLPYFTDGSPQPSPWAFFPLFPLLCSLLMKLGLPFGYAAIVVSLSCTLAALTLYFRWIHSHTKKLWPAIVTTSTLALFPAAGLFQLAYAEGLALLLIVSTLYLVSKGKYLWAVPVVLALGFTRPVGVPDFLVFLIHGLALLQAHKQAHGLTWREIFAKPFSKAKSQWEFFLLLFMSGVSAIIWPLTAILVTGKNAYFEARSGYRPDEFFKWFTTNPFATSEAYPLGTGVYLFGFLIWACILLYTLRSFPLILRVWPLVFTLYIFTVVSPVGNELRYLMLGFFTFPLVYLPAKGWKRWLVVALFLAFVVGMALWQAHWINTHWISSVGELRKVV